jgi:long-chain acyl-CoA synthetase
MSIYSFFANNLKDDEGRSRNFLLFRRDGIEVRRTYGESAERVNNIARAAAGRLALRPRGAPVAIMLDNCAEWIELYLAHNALAVPVVPLDPKLKPQEIAYILNDSKANVIYTDSHHVPVLQEIAADIPEVKAFVLIDAKAHNAPGEISGKQCLDLGAIAEEAVNSKDDLIAAAAVNDDDIASVIYTSGTTGHPKGAILTNGNFCADADAAIEMFKQFVNSSESFFVVLPLFHAFSFNTNFICPMRIGASLQFATSLRTIGEDMRAFKPSIIMAVPLLVEKMHDKIEDGIKKNFFGRWLKRLGLKRLLIPRIKANFGGRLKLFIVGGAPCSAKLLREMRALDMPIIEGYGLTEAAPIVSIRPYDDKHVGTIGIPMPGVEVMLADKDANGVGEILVRGPNVMRGYLGNPEATAEALDKDGWLHTGDLASRDADGFLTIRGRKKALIVNREGKNIYPEEVEICIGRDRHVQYVVVVGYSSGGEVGEKVGVIVVPDMDYFAKENGGREPDWAKVEAKMRKVVAARSKSLADYKTPRKVAVQRDPLVRTSAGKVRRFTYQGALNE